MNERRAEVAAVAFAIAFPSLVTWAYFIALAGQPAAWQQTAYSVGKVIQFAFPAVWAFVVRREPFVAARPERSGLVWNLAFGLTVAIAMLGAYHMWLAPVGFFAGGAGEAIRGKIVGLNLDAAWKYASLGVFYALGHSALEEYYWRWFVFGRLRALLGAAPAIGVSAIGFMAHHVLLLGHFFGWDSPATWLFSAAIAIGGAVWAGLYDRWRSLVGPWLSHLLVDAAIFTIGYDLARSLF